MKSIFKRVAAYIIDIILISILSTILTSNKYLNKDYEKYQKTYDSYVKETEIYNDYSVKLNNFFSDDKISKNEYNKLNEITENKNLIKYYEDNEITQKEFNIIIEKLDKDYSNKQIDYSYKLIKYTIIPTIISLMCILFYFVVIQFYFGGKTLGKLLMNLKVVSNNNKKLTILNFLIRSLIVNEVFINILNIIFILVLTKNNYLVYNQIIYPITYMLEMSIIATILFDKNNRGIHDYISNTKVIESKR